MINLIQPITVQQAYGGITHARLWASWNWWWRKVGDDDGDDFPSPEPRTDSRSALPMKNGRCRWLHIVKRNESFSLIYFLPEREYMELELRLVVVEGTHKGGGGPSTLVDSRWVPSGWFFCQYFFIYSKNILHEVSGHSENFYFFTKITPWQFCWNQR